MTRAVTALAALLLATTGCTYFKHGQSHKGNQEKSTNKLKATTNRLLLETFLEAQLYQPPVPPVKVGFSRTKKNRSAICGLHRPVLEFASEG